MNQKGSPMKIVLRIMIILGAAAIVCGAFYLIFNDSSLAGVSEGRGPGNFESLAEGEHPQNFALDSAQVSGQRPEVGSQLRGGGRPGGFEGWGGGDFNNRSLMGIAENLGKIAAVVLIVIVIQQIVQRFTRRRKDMTEASPPA